MLCLEKELWSTVKRFRQASNVYAPPFLPPAQKKPNQTGNTDPSAPQPRGTTKSGTTSTGWRRNDGDVHTGPGSATSVEPNRSSGSVANGHVGIARPVLVVLREDQAVPRGHVAPLDEDDPGGALGLGGLCERAGLVMLRRTARVRLLSAREGAVTSPR